MAINYRLLTFSITDSTGDPIRAGSVTITPSQQLTDATDGQVIGLPLKINFAQDDSILLAATDNANILPTGWYYTAQFKGLPSGAVVSNGNFLLPYGSGATIDYSAVTTVNPAPPLNPNVSTVFGRFGNITAQSGDYTVAQVTGAAPLASPALTGTPTAPTQTALDNSTKLATTAYTDTAVSTAEAGLVPQTLFSVADDGQGDGGQLIVEHPSVNSIATGAQASAILAGGITVAPNKISGATNLSVITGGYDNIIETPSPPSLGVIMEGGAHQRVYGNSSHSGVLWGSIASLYSTNYSAILSGTQNAITSGDYAVVAGGQANQIVSVNTINNVGSTISGGLNNIVAGGAGVAIGGGQYNVAAQTYATVAGGSANEANGQYSFAAGFGNIIGQIKVVTDGAITANGTTLTCATSTPFASPYIAGSSVAVIGAGVAPANNRVNVPQFSVALYTTIASVTDSGHVVLANAAGTTVTNAYVVIMSVNTSFGQASTIAGGYQNTLGQTASTRFSFIGGGRTNECEGDYSAVLGGLSNQARANYAVASGSNALADHIGSFARASGAFTTQGDNQYELVHVWRKIVNSTAATELLLDGVGTRLLFTANNTAWRYSGEVLAKQTGGTTVNSWHVEGVIVMGTGIATTAMKWATIDTLYSDVATATLTATADTGHGALVLKFQDTAGGAVTWNVGADIHIRKVMG